MVSDDALFRTISAFHFILLFTEKNIKADFQNISRKLKGYFSLTGKIFSKKNGEHPICREQHVETAVTALKRSIPSPRTTSYVVLRSWQPLFALLL